MTWCWIKGHNWKIISYFDYIDISFGLRASSYSITLQCKKCGNIKQKDFYGCGKFLNLNED